MGVLCALGVILYLVMAQFSVRLALHEAAVDTQRESAGLARAMLAYPVDRPLTAAQQAAVGAILRASLPSDYVTVKVWSRSGQILYSTDPSLIGQHFEIDDDQAAALAGQTRADLSSVAKAENVVERAQGFSHLLEVYTPLRAPDGTVVGAFEMYRSADALLADLHTTQAVLLAALVLGLLALWAGLYAWVHRATATIDRQNLDLHQLSEEVREAYQQLQDTTRGALLALSEAVEAKDAYTGGHVQRVCDLSSRIGQRLSLSAEAASELEFAALLHDIGKMAVDDAILRKPGALTPEERRQMEQHSPRGAQLIRHVPGLDGVAAAIRAHHERWDGSGYPDGEAGTDIPLAARIVAIADAYDAMTTDRPYRRALSPEAAMAELRHQRGTQFDPELVDLALIELGLPAEKSPETVHA